MDFTKMTDDQLQSKVRLFSAAIKARADQPEPLTPEQVELDRLHSRLLAAVRLELSRREADINDIPF